MSSQDLWKIAGRLWDASGTTLGASLKVKLSKGDYAGIFSAQTPTPDSYESAQDYFADALCVSFLKKFEGAAQFVKDANPKTAAIANWYAVEKVNAQTNARLARFRDGYLPNPEDPQLMEFINRVKRRVSCVLGPLPRDLSPRFSPGASLTERLPYTTIPDKVSSELVCTSGAKCLFDLFGDTAWARARAEDSPQQYTPRVVRAEKHFTVPKKWDIARNAAMGPNFNVAYQLDAGTKIRNRIRDSLGWDLLKAQEIHRQLARSASLTREFCTIDLKDASDRWARVAVRLLTPDGWFTLLQALRAPCTEIENKIHYLEKFSSMGNGFTFELETLLFIAVCSEIMSMRGHTPVMGVNLFVYGDDIIAPDDCYSDIVAALKFFGHQANEQKSFHGNSPFRESCGADFFLGQPVRAYYHKKGVFNEPQELITLANGLRKLEKAFPYSQLAVRLRGVRFFVLDMLPVDIRRLRGPECLGDAVIHDEEARWQVRTESSIRYVRAYVPVQRYLDLGKFWLGGAQLASALYGTGPHVTWRNSESFPSVSGYRKCWLPFS